MSAYEATRCDARIRPFPNDTEIACHHAAGHDDGRHEGDLRDYSYPGSLTRIAWSESDRRNYHGSYPGRCSTHLHVSSRPLVTSRCVLPAGHRGECAP